MPLEELEDTVRAKAEQLASIPASQLAAMKLVVNHAFENMGISSTQTLGPILDGLMRNTPDALRFIERAEKEGVRAVIEDRDGPWGDYSQARPEDQPDPTHIIEPWEPIESVVPRRPEKKTSLDGRKGVDSVRVRTYVRGMDWERVSNDQIDEAFDHFSGLTSAALARVCELISVVDLRQSWMDDGARNLTDWVAARLRVRHGTAARLVAISRRLRDLPLLSETFGRGELTFDQVEAISRIATVETEGDLIQKAGGLTNQALDRLVRRERAISEDEAGTVWERRKLVRQWNLDESELKFHGRLPGDEGRILDQAIDSRVDAMGPNPETGLFDPVETRSADALTELAATGGDFDASPAQLNVFADLEALTSDDHGTAYLDNTAPIPNATAQRLACDAIIETIIRDGERIIGIGRRSRKVPGWLRRLVYERDDGRCQHPGCRNTRWLHIHHIVPWAEGGPTDIDNLILLCGAHHRLVHERGWHVTGPPNKRVFRRPDWTPYPHLRRPLDSRLAELVRPS